MIVKIICDLRVWPVDGCCLGEFNRFSKKGDCLIKKVRAEVIGNTI